MEFSELQLLQLHKYPRPEIIKDEHVISFLKKINSDFGVMSIEVVN